MIRIHCDGGRGLPLFGWEVLGKPKAMKWGETVTVDGVDLRWEPGPETKDIFGVSIGDIIISTVAGEALRLIASRVWTAAAKTGTRLRIGRREVKSEEDLMDILRQAQGPDE